LFVADALLQAVRWVLHNRLFLVLAPPTLETSGMLHNGRYPHYIFATEIAKIRCI